MCIYMCIHIFIYVHQNNYSFMESGDVKFFLYAWYRLSHIYNYG